MITELVSDSFKVVPEWFQIECFVKYVVKKAPVFPEKQGKNITAL